MCVKEIGLSQSHSSGDPPSAVARLQPCKKNTFNNQQNNENIFTCFTTLTSMFNIYQTNVIICSMSFFL